MGSPVLIVLEFVRLCGYNQGGLLIATCLSGIIILILQS